ncbi:MAG: metallophosphoesterase family protein [Burkholderiaceae bacterium]|nr:metallophosphoesterase family protein [Burkholderiaceae bacterium]
MKLALITDLHANREAVEAVLEHAAAQGVDRYALLGDFVGYGADPGWVVDRVRALVDAGAIAVRGNHDAAVSGDLRDSMVPQAREAVVWTRDQLSDTQRAFLGALPMSATEADALFVHASADAPGQWRYVQSRIDAVDSLQATDRRHTFCGHVHEPRLYHLTSDGDAGDTQPVPGVAMSLSPQCRWLAIVGSAGQPRDGNPAACYGTFDTDSATLTAFRVPYDHAQAAAKIIAAGLPSLLAERLMRGT